MRSYRHAIIIAGLIVITLLAYFQVGRLDFVNYDDPGYITANRHIAKGLTWTGIEWAFTTAEQANWHPLTWLSLMFDISLFGGINSAFEHEVNLLFHVGNVVLLYWVLWRMTSADWPSAAVAALFAVHPIHVESVAWIAERKDVLSAFFGLLALAAYVYYTERPGLLRYLLTFACLALGLMAKPMLVTLPLVFLLLDFWPLKRWPVVSSHLPGVAKGPVPQSRGPKSSRDRRSIAISQSLIPNPRSLLALVAEKLPLLALSLASSIVTYMVQQSAGAMTYSEFVPFDARMMNVVCSYVIYIRKLFWPVDLALMYPLYGRPPLWAVFGSAVLLLAITAVVVLAAALRKSYLAVGWFWYLGMMVPVIGFVQVGAQGMADRYMYLPAIGLYVMLVFGVADLTAALSTRFWPLCVATAMILAACIGLTVRQVDFWSNTTQLYERSIAATVNNPLIHTQYAAYLVNQGKEKYADAIRHCDEALKSDPNYAFAYANKAVALNGLGRPDEAIQACKRALELSPNPETFYSARVNMGTAYVIKGQYDDAKHEFEAVLDKDPNNTAALLNLAFLQDIEGRTAQAVYNLDRLLVIDPENDIAKIKLQRVLEKVPDQALRHGFEALQKDPDDVQAADQIGRSLMRMHNLEGAINFGYQVLAHHPQDSITRTNVGNALILSGRTADGIRELEVVLQADPNHDTALNTLAWIRAAHPFAMVRNGKDAVKWAELAQKNNRNNNPGILDTLAAAYAEDGQFDKAVATAKQAVQRAAETGDHRTASDAEAHLKLYEALKPYHDPLPPGVVDPSPKAGTAPPKASTAPAKPTASSVPPKP